MGAVYVSAVARGLNRASVLNQGAGNAGALDDASLQLVPVPATVKDVSEPVVNLAGEWDVNTNPPAAVRRQDLDKLTWTTINVPNELATQGLVIAPDREYPCRRRISIPRDFANQRIFLRFDGVYSYARVWINGVYIRDHSGGFTSWECEITDYVKAGEYAELVVGVTDRSDDISRASYYAKHLIGGILRDVRLFAVPRTHLRCLALPVKLDENYRNGRIQLSAQLSSEAQVASRLELKLTDESGQALTIQPNSIPIGVGEHSTNADIFVRSPRQWDAEHPNLYSLEILLVRRNAILERVKRRIGFRTVERSGNQLLVNGKSVKLRGVCRHSIHPIYGRAVPAEFDDLDAALFRAANINFVRTSHYPPSERFLDACDRYGIYVEEETAVCWSNVENGPSSDPVFRQRFMNQFGEMITRDRDHPSVLFWSLGNESQWGANFALEQTFAAEHDPGRPTIFSYPDTAPHPLPFAICSKHYPSVTSDLSSRTYPLLNDEFAHVSCYNLDTLRRDPGVRSFWGQSIRQFGEKLISSDGCLGGAIWAGIDEVFLLPDGPAGYGPWGIVDGWRREKPEYWLTKKAYSPIRMEAHPIAVPEDGAALTLPIRNAFDHTNLKETKIHWSCGSESGRLISPDIPAHRVGYLKLPSRAWHSGENVLLEFRARGELIDQFRFPIGIAKPSIPTPESGPVNLQQSSDLVEITGPRFSLRFGKVTGLITEARFDRQLVLVGGPYLDLGEGPLTSWFLKGFDVAVHGDAVRLYTRGECKREEGDKSIPVEFEIRVDGSGLITTIYRLEKEKEGNPQIGVSYVLPSTVEKLAWNGSALWSVYPDDHIGRPQGVALKTPKHAQPVYRTKPEWPWAEDVGDFFLWGRNDVSPQASNDFRSLKENIWYASCILAGGSMRVRAEAKADIAARATVLPDGKVTLSLYNFWSDPDLGWGNYTGPTLVPAMTTHELSLRLTDLPEEL
jgi:hypothetical protein